MGKFGKHCQWFMLIQTLSVGGEPAVLRHSNIAVAAGASRALSWRRFDYPGAEGRVRVNRHSGLVVAGLLWLACSRAFTAGAPGPESLPTEHWQALLSHYRQMQPELGNSRYAGVLDYRQPSWQPRFYLIDVRQRQVVAAYRVAHGKGSDPDHDGHVEAVGNAEDSHMSSVGFYRTGETYISEQVGHGLSLRLDGLSASNHQARERNIVIHANDYMEQHFIDRYGMPGRSHGCLVFARHDRDAVIEKLKGGALIYAVY